MAGDDLEPVPENARLQVDVEEHSDQSVLETRLAYEWLISAVRALDRVYGVAGSGQGPGSGSIRVCPASGAAAGCAMAAPM